ncbi:MAG: hypothetical protein LRZ85_02685 [Alphaproteobacteria bacterium]|nr:hypothetical protein [Alphaproteobacteria bacterium]
MQELAARYTLADLNRELDEVKKSTAPAGEKAKVLEKILGRIEGSSEKGTADDPRAEEQTVRDLLAQNKDLAAEQGKIFAENFWEGFKKDSTKIDAVALAAALGSPPGEPDNTYLFNFLKSQEVTQNNAGYLENRNLLIALNKAVNTSEDPAITEFKGKIGENKTPPTGLYAALALSPDGTDYDKTQKRKAAEAQAEADRKTEEWTNWLYEKGKPFGIERGRAGISHEGVEGAFYGGKGVVSEVAKTFKPITSHLSNPYENPYHWMFNLAAVGVGWALAYKVIKNIPVIGSGIIGPALALAVGYAAWSYLSGSGGMFYNPDGPTKKSSVTQQFKSSANETTTEGLKKPVSVDIDAGNAKLIEARLENGGLGQRADTTHTPLHFRSGQLVQQIKGTGETASAPYLQAVDFDGKPVAFTTLLHRESTAAQGAQHLPASMRADGIDASTGDRHMPRAAGMTTDISLDRPVTSELSL